MTDKNMWAIEDSLYAQGIGVICGVDEAGRGPLAGPVCAAAVILPPHLNIPGLDDSKKLTDKRRRELMPISSVVRLPSPARPQLAVAWGRTSFTASKSILAVPLGASTLRLW